MKCIQCNQENRKSVQFCEECGARLAKKAVTEQDVAARRQIKKVTIGTIGGILVIGALLFSLSQREYEDASNEEVEQDVYEQTDEELASSFADVQQHSVDENGVERIQISENATPMKDMQANANVGQQEEAAAQQSVEALYQQFRLDYRNALNSRTFDSVDHFFSIWTNKGRAHLTCCP